MGIRYGICVNLITIRDFNLVGGFKHVFVIFHFIYGILLPIDELIFFKMVKTTSQLIEFHGGSMDDQCMINEVSCEHKHVLDGYTMVAHTGSKFKSWIVIISWL